MIRLPTVSAYLAALVALAALVGVVGCSHGGEAKSPVTPPELTASAAPPASPADEGVTLGYFQFVFDADGTVRVEKAKPPREAQINVTQYAMVIIENFFFNEEERNWYITATIKNISMYTGYDVWAVFHSLGNKFVINQDGFIWALPPIFPEPTRCAFIAYGKEQPDRMFPPMFQDTRTVIIHQPEGIPKLAPIGFWIDATLKPRKTPGVEDLAVEPIDETNYHLTGYIWDHQSPPSELTVWADCTGFNGNPSVPLYDDGEHGDGNAGDNLFGGDFSGDPEEGFYVLTVYAFDPQGNSGENDVGFWHGEGPCDKPPVFYPFQTLDIGEHSGIKHLEEIVINDLETWLKVWEEHTSWIFPPPPPPPVDFEHHTVIGVWIGDRPSNNHMARIKTVWYDPCEDLVTVEYDYTPDDVACGPLDVVTDPYHIIILPKFDHPVYFVGTEVDCPGPPPECVEEMPIETVVHGVYSGIKGPYELRIDTEDEFLKMWEEHTSTMWPPPPPPEINWEINDVVAVATGERSTGGFECNIYELCWLVDGSIGVFYVERIPGPDCNVPQVFTQPHHWILIPKVDVSVHYFGHQEVYSCGPPECEQPQIFWPIDEGPHTGHPPGEFVFKGPDAFNGFWAQHKPGDPPPPINWAEHMVLAMLVGERPSTGYFVETIEVCLNGMNDPGQEPRIDVSYVEQQPGENCDVLWILTQPFQIVVCPKFDLPVIFHHEAHVYDCPPCEEVPWYQLADGEHSCAPPGEYGFQAFGPEFEDLWNEIHCGYPVPVPPIPEPIQDGIMRPIVVQLPPRPTTGYYITLDYVCFTDCDAYVEYTEHIPGPGCEVEPIPTEPWVFGAAELPAIWCPIEWHFEGHEEVYECPGDCEPVEHWNKAKGEFSCEPPEEFPVFGPDALEDVWAGIHCWDPDMPPPPPVNWDVEVPFVIQAITFPTSGYYLEVNDACVNWEEGLVKIEYTRYEPAPDCPVENIETQPWTIDAIHWFPEIKEFEWIFVPHEEVYECPPCEEVPWYQLDEGHHSCAEPGEYGFQGFSQHFEDLWVDIHCGEQPPLPPIPDPINPGWEIKPFVVQLDERPTTGYYLTIDYVCLEGCNAIVEYTEHIPGTDCDVLPVSTKPWVFGVAEFPPIDCEIVWKFKKNEHVYECPPCQDVPFYELESGDFTCAEPGEYGWQYQDGYHKFWWDVNCYDPDSGDPPPPLPPDPEPIEGGIIYHFGIQLDERPTSGYFMKINNVCIDGCDVFIDYTEMIPGDNCDVEQVITMPWIVCAVELPPVYCYWSWYFEKHEEVYDCPDHPCWEFETIADGHIGGWEPGGWFFDNFPEYHLYWSTYHPDEPMPPINFDGGFGGYAIHLGMRPTTGFEVEVYEICASDDPFGAAVRWVEWIPGETCEVLPMETSPWTLVTFPLVDLPYFDEGREEVYECE